MCALIFVPKVLLAVTITCFLKEDLWFLTCTPHSALGMESANLAVGSGVRVSCQHAMDDSAFSFVYAFRCDNILITTPLLELHIFWAAAWIIFILTLVILSHSTQDTGQICHFPNSIFKRRKKEKKKRNIAVCFDCKDKDNLGIIIYLLVKA